MQNTHHSRPRFDLESRALQFAKDVRKFVRLLPQSIANREDIKQLVRSSGAVGANYIEANESLGKKDFAMRLRIARKEAKESEYWFALLDVGGLTQNERERVRLQGEARELLLILNAILKKVS
jgi:four helix bundle protein